MRRLLDAGISAALGLALQLEKDTVLFLNEVIPHVPPTFAAARNTYSGFSASKNSATALWPKRSSSA